MYYGSDPIAPYVTHFALDVLRSMKFLEIFNCDLSLGRLLYLIAVATNFFIVLTCRLLLYNFDMSTCGLSFYIVVLIPFVS